MRNKPSSPERSSTLKNALLASILAVGTACQASENTDVQQTQEAATPAETDTPEESKTSLHQIKEVCVPSKGLHGQKVDCLDSERNIVRTVIGGKVTEVPMKEYMEKALHNPKDKKHLIDSLPKDRNHVYLPK